MEKRVVITGIGAITPIGNNVDEMWNGILEKKCGVDKITLCNVDGLKTSLAAEVKGYVPTEHLSHSSFPFPSL